MQTFINPSKASWPALLSRPVLDHPGLAATVSSILSEVKQHGDEALKRYSLQFDKAELNDLRVSEREYIAAAHLEDQQLISAIQLARENITKFHRSQMEEIKKIETSAGVWCWRKAVAIESVGLYIPGGTAPLFSTLLMLAIPALLAGCKKIVICTPPNKNGEINQVILYVAQSLGLNTIYKIGGAQAIAAMAYGTQTIPKVHKIFGPGNQYVTAAKQMVAGCGIAIDMPAGPSEVAVYADASCNPAFVAADLLSQAEHGTDSQVLLVTNSLSTAENVKHEISRQCVGLPRKAIIKTALHNSRFVIMENIEEAFDLLNEYAPEHLIIACDQAEELCVRVVNAGSVFLGHYTPESAGDYASGTNHTLPTNGFAKAYSGVSLDSFMKKITFQRITADGIKSIGKAVETMAAAEGLEAHKNAISLRLNSL